MRVIAGCAKRLNLKTIKGMETRPTTDRIKETLFNMINADLYDSSFLDLFAGSGQMGIEALSRGAAKAVFVENNKEAVKCIEENLIATKLKDKADVLYSDVLSALRTLEGKETFSFIFMDPPYNQVLERTVLDYLKDSSLMNDSTIIIIEASKETDFSYVESFGLEFRNRKEYKNNVHVFLEKRTY